MFNSNCFPILSITFPTVILFHRALEESRFLVHSKSDITMSGQHDVLNCSLKSS